MPTRILLIDDDDAIAAVIQQALEGDRGHCFEALRVRRTADGLERLAAERAPVVRESGGIAAILVSLCQRDDPGLTPFERLFRAAPDVPIVVLCRRADEELASKALRIGAQDYLVVESLDRTSLLKSLSGVVERAGAARTVFGAYRQAQATLDSMGDAVLSTDIDCRITFLNAVAERLTGWSSAEAIGRPIDEVFLPVDCTTGKPAPDAMALAISGNGIRYLAQDCMLVRRDGSACAIEDSAAPIHDQSGKTTGAVLVFRDVSDARAASRRLAHSAGHDALTDLPNRALFWDRLVHALALARRQGRRMAVLYLDIDAFKPVNDACGHGVGDGLLQSVARRLSRSVRSSDTVGRQGGDEFLILLSDIAHTRDAELIAGKILQSISMPHQVGAHRLEISASMGISTYPEDAADAESLVSQADAAMYFVKHGGGNRYAFFDASVHAAEASGQLIAAALPVKALCG